MPTIYGIISRGYFPKELPPPFTSSICGKVLSNNTSILPSEFTNPSKRSKNTTHNLLARGTSRRRLGIPNPTSFFKLAKFAVDNWNFLSSFTSQSHISMTTPVFVRGPRAIEGTYAFPAIANQRAHVRSNSRYILKADINQFYHSLYTHSIAWAIHGKSIAKAKKGNYNLLGNALDRLVRNSQDGQTIGIPIGPDTSLLIAELILSAIDSVLSSKGIMNGLRFIDDYEFGCYSITEAESVRAILEEELTKYELALNPGKTSITELPVPIGPLCISKLQTYCFITGSAARQQNEISHYFDQAFALYHEYPSVAVLKYAVQRLSGVKVLPENWPLCESLLLQCATIEPSTLEAVLNQILRYRDMGYSLDSQNIGKVFNRIITRHALLDHGSEVAWSLWGLIILGIHIDDENANRATAMNDSVVALLILDARSKGLVSSSIDYGHFQSYMKTEELFAEQWLLAYEANVKNWLPSGGSGDHVDQDVCFRFLKTNGVYFYDDTMSGRTVYRPPKPPIEGERY